jgi:hypothetical protein
MDTTVESTGRLIKFVNDIFLVLCILIVGIIRCARQTARRPFPGTLMPQRYLLFIASMNPLAVPCFSESLAALSIFC